MKQDSQCRVCHAPSVIFYEEKRTFYKCPVCSLIFTNEIAGHEEAEAHYKGQWKQDDAPFWDNQCDQIIGALSRYGLNKNNRILDFGAGAGNITRHLQKRGYNVTPLEPMEHGYLKDQNYPHLFDVILGVEVIEHIMNLYEELHELEKILDPNGLMFFTTLLTNDFIDTPDEQKKFAGWWYKEDPTHVSFFSHNALFKLAATLKFEVEIYPNQAFALYR